MRKTLALPTRALAEAVAEEWRGQGEIIRPETMPLTKLANTAIDRVRGHEDVVIGTDRGLCQRSLVLSRRSPGRSGRAAERGLGPAARLGGRALRASSISGAGIAHIAQPEVAVAALRHAVAQYDPFALAALHEAATICGSLVLALALAEGRLDAEEAFALSQLDERYQAEKWGADGEAEKRAGALAAELDAAARFMRLTGGERGTP